MSRSVLLIGHGRMGRLVESLCGEYGLRVAGAVTSKTAADASRWPAADVAVDFSLPDAVPRNLPLLAARGTNVVIGTTGWHAREAEMRDVVTRAGIGVVAAPNFAIGVNLFLALTARAAELLRDRPEFGAWIHEIHHAAKKDAPSGTARAIESALTSAGYGRPIDVASNRAGMVPGTHTLGFDAAAETIAITHTARDRTAFARGALQAATWIDGKRGWFGMGDVLGL